MDVHKAIRRAHPAPKARVQRKDILLKDAAVKDGVLVDLAESEHDQAQRIQRASLGGRNETPIISSSPRATALFVRRGSAGQTVSVKANFEDMREHLKHLGPSNPASNPKSTRVSAVKIKPGAGHSVDQRRSDSVATGVNPDELEADTDERTTLLHPRLSQEDGHQDYGSRATKNPEPASDGDITIKVDQEHAKNGSTNENSPTDSIASNLGVPRRSRGHARSGSITENVVEAGGIRKVVLKLTSPGGHDQERLVAETTSSTTQDHQTQEDSEENKQKKKKKKKSGR